MNKILIAALALLLSSLSANAERNPCLDYLEQREAAARLAIGAVVVQVRLLAFSEAEGISDSARKILREASDDLADAIAANTEAMSAIMETTVCR